MLKNKEIKLNGNIYLKDNQMGMVLPCSPLYALIFDKPENGSENDVCPVCGKEITVRGLIMSHEEE